MPSEANFGPLQTSGPSESYPAHHMNGSTRNASTFWSAAAAGVLTFLASAPAAFAQTAWKPSDSLTPAAPKREFRGIWVASVANIDWPSKRTLTVAEQQAEIKAMVAMAASTHINAILLQVRTSCDALYESQLEPWSEFLTGLSGKAPDPMYDPLSMWISECHAHGIELHAWFNPFRARHFEAKLPDAPSHVSNAHPELVVSYDKYKWLDPGADESQTLSLNVIKDVVTRYDIDGVHIDDYFYPYPDGKTPFPDDARYQAYKTAGGTLSWDDWRRDRINQFVHSMYDSVKAIKPHVKVGISPFGIWRPGNPPGIEGFDAYAKLYADSKLWLEQGWMDYCSPQLYWQISAPKQPFEPLLTWWLAQNPKNIAIIPGLNTSKLDVGGKWPTTEITSQIELTRTKPQVAGVIQFSAKALLKNYKGITTSLASTTYIEPALMPQFANCGPQAPAPLEGVKVEADTKVAVTWTPPANERFVVVGWNRKGTWQFQVMPAAAGGADVDPDSLEAAAIAPLGRNGALGSWSVWVP
jgi:uncharacterized lipoprotein YddW (UPF0748 family)